ncbi:MAG: peptide chain release factor N(5)-glutamine methyltransferase [Terriglobales bacterium]
MPNLRQLLADAAAELERAHIAEPRLTAEILLAHGIGQERSYLYAHPEMQLPPPCEARARAAIAARAGGTPLQYVTGEQDFYGRSFTVSPAVLIPRPETGMVVEAALERMPASAAMRIVDVGTGSGCIAITLALERPHARVTATDLSPGALAVARSNATRLGARVGFVVADLLTPLTGGLDLIVSNPPYVAENDLATLQPEVRDHEPHLALTSGPKGSEIYERLIPQAHGALRPGGWIVLELGYDSAPHVIALLQHSGWHDIETRRDALGWQRVATARR